MPKLRKNSLYIAFNSLKGVKKHKQKWLKFSILTFALSSFAFVATSFKPKPAGIKTVVIDAGHGGKDPGCNGAEHTEKEVTLAIALKLGKLIEEHLKDVKVIYTRKTDVFVELEERAQIANRNNADLFISIHCNAAGSMVTYKDSKGKTRKKEVHNPKPFGSETYVMGIKNEKGKMEVAKRENASMLLEDNYESTYNGFDPNSDEAYIIMSLTTSAYVEQSAKFASYIQEEYTSKAGRIDKGVQRQSIWVLWRTAMPSILTEVGFLTNPQEEKFLGSEKGQFYMAAALFRALRNYKDEVEGKSIVYDDEFEKQTPLENENLLLGDSAYVKEMEEYKSKLNSDSAIAANKEVENKLQNQKYEVLIAQAKKSMDLKKYTDAENALNDALEIKKEDKIATAMLIEIKSIKEKAQNEKEAQAQQKQYNDLIKSAEKFYLEKNWVESKDSYTKAALLKPNEKTPKEQIKLIDEKIAEEKESKTVSTNEIIDNYKNKKEEETKKSSPKNGVDFRVQFTMSNKELNVNEAKFSKLQTIQYYLVGNTYKYTAGSFVSAEEAIAYQTKVRSIGFKDAFVVAFQNGQRIDYNQAIKLAGK